jgi:hypothetical protein
VTGPNQRRKLTGAAILVLRASTFFQAAPAGDLSCSAARRKGGREGWPIFRTLVVSLSEGLLEVQNEEATATEGSHGRTPPPVRFRGLFCLHRRAERVPVAVRSFLCDYARAVKWLKPLPCLSRMGTRSRARPVRASQKSCKGQSARLAKGVRNMSGGSHPPFRCRQALEWRPSAGAVPGRQELAWRYGLRRPFWFLIHPLGLQKPHLDQAKTSSH